MGSKVCIAVVAYILISGLVFHVRAYRKGDKFHMHELAMSFLLGWLYYFFKMYYAVKDRVWHG